MTRAERRHQQERIQAYRDEITMLQSQLADARQVREELEKQLLEAERRSIDLERAVGREAVLASDRDRLTTAVEVLARRIVSPAAETDPTRAGWRHVRRSDHGVDPTVWRP